MAFALVLAAASVACALFRSALKAHPCTFYAGAVVLTVLYGFGSLFELPDFLWQPLYVLMQQCVLSMALFVVVMFTGVFAAGSWASRCLRPIRSELSILACLLSVGHMVVYLLCIPRLFGPGLVSAGVLVGFVVALVLLALTVVLGSTSGDAVKRRLGARKWKNVQRWAYLFYALVYVHLMLVLMPSVEQGVVPAQVTAAIYTVVFAAYAVLRVRRFVIDTRPFPFAMAHSESMGFDADEAAHNAF